MEFFLGAFEKDWQRRRATLLHELKAGQSQDGDWDWRKRGGVGRLPGALRTGRVGARRGKHRSATHGGSERPMQVRYAALARGSQPAVVKLASYGGAGRVGAMVSYAAREGALGVENERGEHLSGKVALKAVREEWEHLFDNRADSRDAAVFNVTISHFSSDRRDVDAVARVVLRTGFGDRRFVYATDEHAGDVIAIRGVVVLRDKFGERLTGDGKAAEFVRERFDERAFGTGLTARFRFHGYGNGVPFATARVRDLVDRFEGEVRDETGRRIGTREDAGDLVQKEWRREMHSRKGRDVMHLIVSARAGTDQEAFRSAVRDFLGGQFAGHRYVFAVHDPLADPRDTAKGGRRPHVHAHAIITMRSETGGRILTSPKVFREWRAHMAEKAREHGIDMELTDRRDRASPPAYTRNQVRPVSYEGRTEHEGTSDAAQARYDARRSNVETIAGSLRTRSYVEAATDAWRAVAANAGGPKIASYAEDQIGRIRNATARVLDHAENSRTTTPLIINMIISRTLADIEETAMQHMTRSEFVAYENRVEVALSDVERMIGQSDRANFEEIAAAAREVVGIRREYLDLSERQQVEGARRLGVTPEYLMVSDEEASRFGRHDAATGHGAMSRIEDDARAIRFARVDGRDTVELERQMSDGMRLDGELGASGSQMLGAEAGHWPHLRDAIQEAEARLVIAELEAARRSVDQAKFEMTDTGPAEKDLASVLQKTATLALDGNRHLRDHAMRDPQLRERLAGDDDLSPDPVSERVDPTFRHLQAPDRVSEAIAAIAHVRGGGPVHRSNERESDVVGRDNRDGRDSGSDNAIVRHGERAVREGDEILALYTSASVSLARVTRTYRVEYARSDIDEQERAAVRAQYVAATNRYGIVLARYAREVLDGNAYLHERSRSDENVQQALREEADRRASRRSDLREADRDTLVDRHGEAAVRTGDALFARIDGAERAIRDIRQEMSNGNVPSGATFGGGDRDSHGEDQRARLAEVEAKHAEALQEAAKAALDGNTYLRDMGRLRPDLDAEIQAQESRRPEAAGGRNADPYGTSQPDRPADRGAMANEGHRADPPQQHVPRLRQIELELEERRERDERER